MLTRRAVFLSLLVAAACTTPQRPAPNAPPPKAATTARPDAALTAWLTDSMVKVGPDDPTAPAAKPNATPLALFAARNEFESAQVHVHAAHGPRTDLRVKVTDLVGAKGNSRIVTGRDIAVSLEGYQTIDKPSAPHGKRGRVPDILFPERDTLTGETRNAFPFAVPAEETRSVWIDVFVPPETPAGDYSGEVQVLEGDVVRAVLPLSLRVWGFSLPSTATLQSFFSATPLGACIQYYGSYDACRKYPGAGENPDRGVEASHVAMARMLLDHRVTSGEVAYAGSAQEGWQHFDHVYDPLLFGTAPTRLVGARMTTFAYVGRDNDTTLLRNWYSHAKQKGWDNRLVYYQCDEPPRMCSFDRFRGLANTVHAISPTFPTVVTTEIDAARHHEIVDSIDILVPNVAHLAPRDETSRRGDYSAFLQKPRKRLWWYQACSQHGRCSEREPVLPAVHWPSYMVDASPVENRIFQWLAFVYGVSGELYYQVDHCWTHPCGGNAKPDPFASVRDYAGNGDGTLVYPGVPSRIGGTSPTVLSSIRLEHIRDGFEDYEYLWMLQAGGERGLADEITKTFIESATVFADDPSRLVAARRRIGEHLHERATKH